MKNIRYEADYTESGEQVTRWVVVVDGEVVAQFSELIEAAKWVNEDFFSFRFNDELSISTRKE